MPGEVIANDKYTGKAGLSRRHQSCVKFILVFRNRKMQTMTRPSFEDSLFASRTPLPDSPSASDVLFFWRETDVTGSTGLHDGKRNRYADSFREAADLLIAQTLQGAANQESALYPIVYLYRQYLELSIKDSLQMTRLLLDDRRAVLPHHRVVELWQELNEFLVKILPGDAQPGLVQTARLVREFIQHDTSATVFRHPVDVKGRPLFVHAAIIDLANLRDVMGKVDGILSQANGIIYERWKAGQAPQQQRPAPDNDI